MSIARSGAADIVVGASPEAVWRVVSDVTRTGEWSSECRAVAWQGAVREPVPGARFRGRNRLGWRRWSRTCELMAIDPPREIAWRTLPGPLFPDSSTWRIALEPADHGTRIRLSYQVTQLPVWMDRVLGVVTPAHADRTAALADDLRRLGQVAATEVARTPAEG